MLVLNSLVAVLRVVSVVLWLCHNIVAVDRVLVSYLVVSDGLVLCVVLSLMAIVVGRLVRANILMLCNIDWLLYDVSLIHWLLNNMSVMSLMHRQVDILVVLVLMEGSVTLVHVVVLLSFLGEVMVGGVMAVLVSLKLLHPAGSGRVVLRVMRLVDWVRLLVLLVLHVVRVVVRGIVNCVIGVVVVDLLVVGMLCKGLMLRNLVLVDVAVVEVLSIVMVHRSLVDFVLIVRVN